MERFAANVFHDEPMIAAFVDFEIVKMNEMSVLQIEALANAAQVDVLMTDEAFEGDFLAAVGEPEIDLAEAARTDAALDRVAGERFVAAAVGERHGGARHEIES